MRFACLLLLLVLVPCLPVVARAEEAFDGLDDLDTTHPPTARLARTLATLAGRAALLELAAERAERTEREVADALRWLEHHHHEGERANAWLEEQRATWQADVALLEATVASLERSLAGDDAISTDLRTFLARGDAARTLYRALVRSRLRPFALQAVLARSLTSDDAGRLHVPAALAANAAALLGKDRRATRALERIREVAGPLRTRLEREFPRRWTLGGMDEDLWCAVCLHAAGGRGDDPEAVAEELVAWVAGTGGGTATQGLRRGPRLQDLLATRRVARAYANQLAPDPALDAWRELLDGPRALLLSPGGRLARGHPVDVLLNRTPFGRAFVANPAGEVRVNPHVRADLDRLLVALRDEAQRAAAIEPDDEPLHELARWTARAPREDPVAAWMAATLEETPTGRRVREEVDLLGLHARALRVAERLGAGPATLRLDLAAVEEQTQAIDLLRSSIFYNPRTPAGHYAYVTQFDDHHAARLFGLFGWNAKVSKDLADFKQRIRARSEQLRQLAKTHDKLIIHISGVPPWLSAWEGEGTFEGGGWEDRQAHPPKDVETWKQMIRELALVFREVEGVERYYEFWNEPDLKYWQGSLEDFLALYEATVTTIRETDPEGKVGGPAVNQWDGRIHKKTGSDVLVHELIRFAAKHELPLDFVSWHHFGRPVAAIAKAKASYAAELAKHGFDPGATEYLVTEWSAPGRGTPYGNVFFAETMLGLFHARVDAQTASCWEEFHAKPDPKGFPPWGLMTQQGDRHGTWFVHRFFDRLARDSRGVAVVRPDDETTVVVSRKDDGVRELLVWRTGLPSPLAAALRALDEADVDRARRRWFGTVDRFERALHARGPTPPGWAEAFEAACDAYAAAGPAPERLVLALAGASDVTVEFAESVRTEHGVKRGAVLGNTLTCPLARYEVLRLVLRVR